MTLASLFNAPTELEFEGEKYLLRKPNQLEEGMYQRWLEQLAWDKINARTYQDEAEKLASLRMHDHDCAAGVFEYGGEVSVKRLMTPKGLAKLIAIICRDQGMTDEQAERWVELENRKIAAVLVSKATDDPKALAAALAILGLPKDFLSCSSSTNPSEPPPTSNPSAACATSS